MTSASRRWLRVLVAVLVGASRAPAAVGDEDSCLSCTNYESFDGPPVCSLESGRSGAQCGSNDAAPAEFLPLQIVAELVANAPTAMDVAQECFGESEELCSLLLATQRLFNATLAGTAELSTPHAAGRQRPGMPPAPETRFYADLGGALQGLKGGHGHVVAHAALQLVRNGTAAFWDAASAPFRIATTTAQAITSYLGGDADGARGLLHSAIAMAEEYHAKATAANSSSDDAGEAAPLHTALRSLLSTLLFTQSKLKVELGKWSEGLVIAEKAAQWSNGTAFLHEWRGRLHEQLNDTTEFLTLWKQAVVLNPYGRDRFVWPIYCLANRLHGVLASPPSSPSTAAAALLRTVFDPDGNGGTGADQPRLFATLPRQAAELEFVRALAAGNDRVKALAAARVGGRTDDLPPLFARGATPAARAAAADAGVAGVGGGYATLAEFVAHVRSMECSDDFIVFRNNAVHGLTDSPAVAEAAAAAAAPTATGAARDIAADVANTTADNAGSVGDGDGGTGDGNAAAAVNTAQDQRHQQRNARARHYSWSNFAYGAIYYTGFGRLFARPAVAAQMADAVASGLDVVVLGSNVGVESTFFALTYPGVHVYGYDLLCAFVGRARELAARFGVRNVDFFCADALTAAVGNAALVFIDNQAWDRDLVTAIWQKLQREAPVGALVVEFGAADYYAGIVPAAGMQMTLCSSMDVSWSPFAGTHVSVFRKTEGVASSGQYFDYYEYSSSLRHLLSISAKLAAQLQPTATDVATTTTTTTTPPLWCRHSGLARLVSNHTDCAEDVSSSPKSSPFFPRPSDVEALAQAAHRSPVLLTTARFADRVVAAFQRLLFQWHAHRFWCRADNFGPVAAGDAGGGSGTGAGGGCVAREFSEAEAAYLRHYFELSGAEFRNFALTGRWVGNRMSSYSYSHRFKPLPNSAATAADSAAGVAAVDGDAVAAPERRRRNAISATAPPPLRVDSARFRLGTTSQEHLLLAPALAVLRERGIRPPAGLCTRDAAAAAATGTRRCFDGDHGDGGGDGGGGDDGMFIFYGFGWDMGVDAFKVYYMFHGLSTVPEELRRAAGMTAANTPSEEDLMGYGLLSFTYSNADNSLLESKIYVYPRTAQEAMGMGVKMPSKYLSTVAVMFSDKRGTVAQFDMEQVWSCIWRAEFSAEGRAVMDTYMDVGLNLETLTFASNESYTLYFPSGSG